MQAQCLSQIEVPMFEHLLRELDTLKRGGISVSLPTDADGYLDRECPNESCLFGFKTECEDWQNKVADDAAYCPMCRHSARKSSWHTQEQVEFMQQSARAHLDERLGHAMQADARTVNAAQRPGQFLTMKLSVKHSAPTLVLPLQAAEPMRQRASCEACGCRYSYLGSAFFCPACGHNSAAHTFQQSLSAVGLAATIGPQLRASLPPDEAEIMARLLREKGLGDVVTAIQRLAEQIWESLPGTKNPPRNVFQRLDDGSRLWATATGQDFSAFLSVDELKQMRLCYQQRHALAHCEGIVDADYIRKSGDTSLAAGQRIIITEAGLLEFVTVAQKLGTGLLESYRRPVPPFPKLKAPSAVAVKRGSRYSENAIAIARLLVERSETGRQNDPMLSADGVREATRLNDDDITEALHELDRDGLVIRHQSLGMGMIGFHTLAPEEALFKVFDPILGMGDPVADARVLADRLTGDGDDGGDIAVIAEAFGWSPRRMNPAVGILIAKGLVTASQALDSTWTTKWVRRQPGLRTFAQST